MMEFWIIRRVIFILTTKIVDCNTSHVYVHKVFLCFVLSLCLYNPLSGGSYDVSTHIL